MSSPRKRLSHPSAGKVIGTNVDLLTIILVRLPVLSLIRLKAVSKFWLTLISDPQFAGQHTRNSPNSPISGFYLYKKTEQLKPVSFGCDHILHSLDFLKCIGGVRSQFVIISSSNGLLLCRFCNKFEPSGFIVCNPATGYYRVLQKPTNYKGIRYAVLASDPRNSPLYNVVFFSLRGDLRIDVFSSDTASWKQLKVFAPPEDLFTCAFYWDGCVHWMSSNGIKNFYFRLNLQTKKLKVVQMLLQRRIRVDLRRIRYFGECGGRLLLIHTPQGSPSNFDIFEMGHECKRLTLRFSVNLESCIPENLYGSLDGDFSVLHVKEEAEDKALEVLIAVGNKVVSYNTGSRALAPLSDLMSLSCGYQSRDCFSDVYGYKFVENIAPV